MASNESAHIESVLTEARKHVTLAFARAARLLARRGSLGLMRVQPLHFQGSVERTWTPLVNGLEVVQGFDASNLVFHDPHVVRLSPADPDRLWQQNHCGIYRLDRPSDTWVRVGRNMPRRVGDVGFPIVVHPRDRDVAWVFPMDGTVVWPRTCVGGTAAAYVTRDGGKTWRRLDRGLPQEQAWWTVKRQAMTRDGRDPVGLYLGTTGGELWASRDEGDRWTCLARSLPEIYALETGEPAR